MTVADSGVAPVLLSEQTLRVKADATPLERQRKRLFWPFVAPALAIYAIFMLAPTIGSLWISLTEWRAQGDPMRFVGLKNYALIVTNSLSQRALVNTIGILLIAGLGIFILAFAITIFMREMRFRNTVRSLLFFPYLITPVAIGIVLGLVLDPNGILNSILSKVGLSKLTAQWLDLGHIYWSLLTTIVWVTTGFYVILLASGMDRIPRDYYEACELAGANLWQKFRYVTLPMSWDIVTIAAILWVINSFKIFELILAFGTLGSSVLPAQVQNLSTDQYYLTVGGRYPTYAMGQGSAVGIVMLILVGVCVVLIRRFMHRDRIEF